MARDPKKVEKALMKKRRKQKQAARNKHQSTLSILSVRGLIHKARHKSQTYHSDRPQFGFAKLFLSSRGSM